jgi:tRNA nucleotidyltransferase (CCA-adding enzyme)
MALLREMVANGEVDALQPERVWQELRRSLDEDDPAAFFELLRECGALTRLFPEVDALFGVPQTPKHHPEIDTGVHVMMALRVAAKLRLPTETRFAVLCHDLGKGTTPKDILPKHHGHEARGVPLVEALCARLRAPNSFRELAVIAARYHLHVHLAKELRPQTIMELFDATGALRSPERFDRFLQACEADSRGRTGREDSAYPQADFLREALKVAQAVQAAEFADAGLKGEEIGKELRRRRISALTDWKATKT